MFVKPVEKLINKLSIYEKDFLLQFIVNNRECPEIFYINFPNIQKINHFEKDDNSDNLLDITNKDITKIKKAIKDLDGSMLKYYTTNYKFFSKTQNSNPYIKIITREEEDIFIYL